MRVKVKTKCTTQDHGILLYIILTTCEMRIVGRKKMLVSQVYCVLLEGSKKCAVIGTHCLWTAVPKNNSTVFSTILLPASDRSITEANLSRTRNVLAFISRKQWLIWPGHSEDQRLQL